MKITIKLTKKEKELFKKANQRIGLGSNWGVDGWLIVVGGNWGDNLSGYAFGVKFRKELYRVLKELESQEEKT